MDAPITEQPGGAPTFAPEQEQPPDPAMAAAEFAWRRRREIQPQALPWEQMTEDQRANEAAIMDALLRDHVGHFPDYEDKDAPTQEDGPPDETEPPIVTPLLGGDGIPGVGLSWAGANIAVEPYDARQFALTIIEVAEIAEQEAVLYHAAKEILGDAAKSAALIGQVRQIRAQL